jgi:hypothetical protein
VFIDLLERISTALDSASLPYMVIGGQAVLIYGEPRLTKDIDITLGLGTDALDKIVKITSHIGLTPLIDDAAQFVSDTLVFPTIDQKTGVKVDFIFSFSPYERQAIDRATRITIDKNPIRFVSIEDLLIHKIIAGRPRDIEDVKSILLKKPDFNRLYVERWLREFERALELSLVTILQDIIDSTA